MTHTRRQLTDLLDRHGLSASRALGQNFVADPNTVRRIARLAAIGPDDHVVEIGAGLGSLTLALVETGATVTAVELDRHLLPALREVVADTTVTVVAGDARELDWTRSRPPRRGGSWWPTCPTTSPLRWSVICSTTCRPSIGCWSWCSARRGSGSPPTPETTRTASPR